MTINKLKVENMESSRGNTVPNQFIITTDEGRYFQSYQSIIAFIPNTNAYDETCEKANLKTVLDVNKWDYSKTTGKYRNEFLGESKKETEAKIKSGEYKLADLN